MTKFAVPAVVCLAVVFLAFAGGAAARTDDQAYRAAYHCLVSHGAKNVRPQRPVGGGGEGEMRGLWFTWWYHPDYSTHVEGVSVAICHGWPHGALTMATSCVQKSVGLGPAGWLHISEE
jgi:hypothetical protein